MPHFYHIFIPHIDKAYLLENGRMYHIAHGAAIIEYVVSSYYWPSSKTYPYVSNIGIGLVVFGQMLRSAAMIHASSNFSHAVAFYKLEGHRLVVDGVYRWVLNSHFGICTYMFLPVGPVTLRILGSFTGALGRNSFYKIP